MADDKNVYTVKINIEGVEAEANRAGKQLNDGIGSAARKVKKDLNVNLRTTNTIAGHLKTNMKTIAGFLGIEALGQSFASGIKSMARFNLKLAETSTLLEGNSKVTTDVKRSIENLSAQFGKDKADLAAAYYDIVSAATSDAKESVDLLTEATKLSVVGVSDAETATGSILSVMNAYGKENMSAGKAANQLFAIVKAGRTNMTLLGSSIGDVVATAAQLGVPFNEVGGALAVSTKTLGSTAKATTALNAALNNILKPSKQVQEMMGALNEKLGTNIEFSAQALKEKGLVGFLSSIVNITKPFKNSTQLLTDFFGSARAVKAIMSLTGESFEDFVETSKKIEGSTNILDSQFTKIDSTLSQKFDKTVQRTKNNFGGLIEFFEPALKGVLDEFNFFGVEAFEQLGRMGKDALMTLGLTEGSEQVNEDLKVLTENTNSLGDAIGKVAEIAPAGSLGIFDLGNKAKGASGPLNELKLDTQELAKAFQQQLASVLAGGMAKAINSFVNALVNGSEGFKNFGKTLLMIIGDMAQQMGMFFLTTGLSVTALASNPLTAGPALIAGGSALIAFGALVKALAGGGGDSASGGAGSAFATGGTFAPPESPLTIGETEEDLTPEAIEKQQMVQVVVNGDIFDSEETGTRILNILDENFQNKGGRLVVA